MNGTKHETEAADSGEAVSGQLSAVRCSAGVAGDDQATGRRRLTADGFSGVVEER